MKTQQAVFHEGEIAIQKKLGVAEKVGKFAPMMIRDHMPQQHREFYQQLPFIFAGHQDSNGDIWASILTNGDEKKFISSPDDKNLVIAAQPFAGDPLGASLTQQKHSSEHELRLGILGIELHTHRRNRMSAKVVGSSENDMQLSVLQTFGNCPQYIQNRELVPVQRTKASGVTAIQHFDGKVANVISNADTFFVASSSQTSNSNKDVSNGADVSHRGGRPGFVKVTNDSLLIPDFTGNNMYNTLGNFAVNPKAGLLFIDFSSGDIITLTGSVEILWEHESKAFFKGAERFWQFKLEHGFVLHNALPWRFELNDMSPNNLMTGTWAQANALKEQESQKHQWHKFAVKKVKDESPSIRSFWFDPQPIIEGAVPVKPDFKPGQHITIRAGIDGKLEVRNYTVSNSPHDSLLRISVKRDGKFSNWLHDALAIGDVVEMKLPSGNFTLTKATDEKRPAVLLSAGIGITPMVSMLRHSFFEGIRTRSPRSVVMINTFRRAEDMAFVEEVTQLSKDSEGAINAFWLLTAPETDAVKGQHYSAKGRLTPEILQQLLPIRKYDFFLCGPGGFMQDTYDMLLGLGIADEDIYTEAFGPSSLKRQKPKALDAESPREEAADSAVVTFNASNVEQLWSKEDGNLLDFAEAHGLTPEFGCRGGSCGSCKVKVLEGKVTHKENISADVAEDEALLCCAMPAKSGDKKLIIEA